MIDPRNLPPQLAALLQAGSAPTAYPSEGDPRIAAIKTAMMGAPGAGAQMPMMPVNGLDPLRTPIMPIPRDDVGAPIETLDKNVAPGDAFAPRGNMNVSLQAPSQRLYPSGYSSPDDVISDSLNMESLGDPRYERKGRDTEGDFNQFRLSPDPSSRGRRTSMADGDRDDEAMLDHINKNMGTDTKSPTEEDVTDALSGYGMSEEEFKEKFGMSLQQAAKQHGIDDPGMWDDKEDKDEK